MFDGTQTNLNLEGQQNGEGHLICLVETSQSVAECLKRQEIDDILQMIAH